MKKIEGGINNLTNFRIEKKYVFMYAFINTCRIEYEWKL